MTSALLVTHDVALREEVLRVAASVGIDVLAPPDAHAAATEWRRAAVVIVGGEEVADIAAYRWGRRAGVFVVHWGEPPDAVFRPALAMGAEAVLELPAASPRLAETLADAGEGRVSRAVVVGVIGGSGGVGATTFAAAVAQAAAPRRRAMLIDTDMLGPGLDVLFATSGTQGLRWSELHGSTGRLGGRTVREALPRIGDLPFLTWGGAGRMPTPDLIRELGASARKANDLVVIDLSRSLDAVAAEGLSACDLVLVVARADPDGMSATNRLLAQLPDRSRARVVVRGGSVRESAYAAPILLRMRDQRGIQEAVALGLGPCRRRRGPLPRAAAQVLSWLEGGAT